MKITTHLSKAQTYAGSPWIGRYRWVLEDAPVNWECPRCGLTIVGHSEICADQNCTGKKPVEKEPAPVSDYRAVPEMRGTEQIGVTFERKEPLHTTCVGCHNNGDGCEECFPWYSEEAVERKNWTPAPAPAPLDKGLCSSCPNHEKVCPASTRNTINGGKMTPLERTIWNLEKLAACPYCGENPCDHFCVMLKDSDDLTERELEDRDSLKIARIALESAKKISQ